MSEHAPGIFPVDPDDSGQAADEPYEINGAVIHPDGSVEGTKVRLPEGWEIVPDEDNDRLEFRDTKNDARGYIDRNSAGDLLSAGGDSGYWEATPDGNAIQPSTSGDETRVGTHNRIRVTPFYGDGTIQDALDVPFRDEGSSMDRALRAVYITPIDGRYDEAVTVDVRHLHIYGWGQSSQIDQASDNHTVTVRENDVFIDNLAIDHDGSGDYDAIKVDANKNSWGENDETQLFRVSVDRAPRFGFNISARDSHLVGCECSGGDVAGWRFDGPHIQSLGMKGADIPGDGIRATGNASELYLTGIIWANSSSYGAGGHGLTIENGCRGVQGILGLDSAGGDGVRVDSENHNLTLWISGSSGDDLHLLSNAHNSIYRIWCNGSATIESGATENLIQGRIEGSITDNGTRTVINGVGTNSGNPASSGEWNGHADWAHKSGATVWDVSSSPNTAYIASPNGGWLELGTAQ